MIKNTVWVKLLTIIILQALLLTQVDCALAESLYTQDSYWEIALKACKTADKLTSFISGITCVQFAISGFNFLRIDLKTVFLLFNNIHSPTPEIVRGHKSCQINIKIYDVFVFTNYMMDNENILCGILKDAVNIKKYISIVRTQESTGPPMIGKNSEEFSSRII